MPPTGEPNGDPAYGSDAQGLGRESNGTRSAYTGHPTQCFANLPPTTPPCFLSITDTAVLTSTQSFETNWGTRQKAVNKYDLDMCNRSFACGATLAPSVYGEDD